MTAPLVCCLDCARTWHSQTMADGLRAIGRCPRCRGTLQWQSEAQVPAPVPASPGPQAAAASAPLAPHLVLGMPRR